MTATALGLSAASGCVQLLGTDLDTLFLREQDAGGDARNEERDASIPPHDAQALDGGGGSAPDARPRGTTAPPPDAGFSLRSTSLLKVTTDDITYCAYDAAGYVRTAQCGDQRWAIYVNDTSKFVQVCVPETLRYLQAGPSGAPAYTATCWAEVGTEIRTIDDTVLLEQTAAGWLVQPFLFEELPADSTSPGFYLRSRFSLADRSYVTRQSSLALPDGGAQVTTFYKLYPRKVNDSQVWRYE